MVGVKGWGPWESRNGVVKIKGDGDKGWGGQGWWRSRVVRVKGCGWGVKWVG